MFVSAKKFMKHIVTCGSCGLSFFDHWDIFLRWVPCSKLIEQQSLSLKCDNQTQIEFDEPDTIDETGDDLTIPDVIVGE